MHPDHFDSSSSALIASSNFSASIFAAPGSSDLEANTSLPLRPNVTRSSFLPSSNFADHGHRRRVEAGLCGRGDERGRADVRQPGEQAVDLCLVGVAGVRADAPPLRRRVPFPLTRSNTTVWPLRVSSTRVALKARNSNMSLRR